MRLIVGLDAPTAGSVTVNGRRYAEHAAPLHEVGALLEARAVHTGRTATNHLLAMAATAGIGRRRVAEVIELVGLGDVADKRAGAFSLGMGQRLGIASALLGDPATLLLDEPVNGLDPDGILWVRTLLRGLADEGRTVFLSSHLMSEMEMTADHLIVVGRGRLLRDMSLAEFIADAGGNSVRVRTPQASELRGVLSDADVTVSPTELTVRGLTADEIGTRAADASITLFELTPIRSSLEEAYMEITRESVEYRGGFTADRTAA
jgi:ABC-2 type transport system ATP-binding protein